MNPKALPLGVVPATPSEARAQERLNAEIEADAALRELDAEKAAGLQERQGPAPGQAVSRPGFEDVLKEFKRAPSDLPPDAKRDILLLSAEMQKDPGELADQYKKWGAETFRAAYAPEKVKRDELLKRYSPELFDFDAQGQVRRQLERGVAEIVERSGAPASRSVAEKAIRLYQSYSDTLYSMYGLGRPETLIREFERPDEGAGLGERAWASFKALPLSLQVQRLGFESYAGMTDPSGDKLLIEGWRKLQDVQSGKGFFDDLVVNAAGAIPEFLVDAGIQAAGAGIGFAAGGGAAIAAGQAGPQAAAPEEVVTAPVSAVAGASWGRTVADALWGYVSYSGMMWAAVLSEADAMGVQIDRNAARKAIHTTAAALAVTMATSMAGIIDKAPGFAAFMRKVVGENAKKIVGRFSKVGAVRMLGQAAATGALVAAGQSIGTVKALEAGTGQDIEGEFGQHVEAAVRGAALFAVLGLASDSLLKGTARLADTVGQRAKAEATAGRVAAIRDVVQGSKVLKENPEFVSQISKKLPLGEEILIRRSAFEAAAEDAGTTVEGLYEGLTGTPLDREVTGDIPVPASAIGKLVSDEKTAGLVDHVVVTDGGLTLLELAQKNKELLGAVEEAAADPVAFADTDVKPEDLGITGKYDRKGLYSRLVGSFMDAGVSDVEAQSSAAVLTAALEAQTAKLNEYAKANKIKTRWTPDGLYRYMLGEVRVEGTDAKVRPVKADGPAVKVEIDAGDVKSSDSSIRLEQRAVGFVIPDGDAGKAGIFPDSIDLKPDTAGFDVGDKTSWSVYGYAFTKRSGHLDYTLYGDKVKTATVDIADDAIPFMLESRNRIMFMDHRVRDLILSQELPGPLAGRPHTEIMKMTGIDLYRYLSEQLGGRREATEWLRERGVRGMIHVTKKTPHSPVYVVFDPADIEQVTVRDTALDVLRQKKRKWLEAKREVVKLEGMVEGQPQLKGALESARAKLKEIEDEGVPSIEVITRTESESTGAGTPNAEVRRSKRDAAQAARVEELRGAASFKEAEFEKYDPDFLTEIPKPLLEQDERGAVTIDALGRGVTIHLVNADKTTLMHEVSHVVVTLAERAAKLAPGSELDAEHDALARWMGYESGADRRRQLERLAALQRKAEKGADVHDEIRTIQAKEERFSYGFEAYLSGDSVPPPGLARVFRRFKNWVIDVYGGIAGIDAQYRRLFGRSLELSPEIEDLMASLITVNSAAKDAEKASPLVPALKLSEEGARKDEYAALTSQQAAEAEAILLGKVYDDIKNGRKDAYEITSDLAREAKDRVERLPHRAAVTAIRSKQVPGMNPELVPEEFRSKLRGRRLLKKGGISPDTLAELVGAESGEALIKAILDAPPKREEVRQVHRQLIQERFPSLVDREVELIQHADRAFANNASLRRSVIEMRDLAEKAGESGDGGISLVVGVRQATREDLMTRPSGDINPDRYIKAVARFRAESHAAAAKGDYREALKLKRAEIVALAKAVEARAVSDEIRRHNDALKRFLRPDVRGVLGKVQEAVDSGLSRPYIAAADRLLKNIGLGTDLVAEPFAPIGDVLRLLEDDGVISRVARTDPDDLNPGAWVYEAPFDIDTIQGLMANGKPVHELTLSELRNVSAFLGALMGSARARVEAEFSFGAIRGEKLKQALLDELNAGISAGFEEKGRKANFKRFIKGNFLDPEWLFYELGNGRTDSVWYQMFQKIREGIDAEHALQRIVVESLDKVFSEFKDQFPAKWHVTADVFGGDPNMRINRNMFRMIVLNMAAEGNRERLLRGYGWDESLVLDYIRENLTEEEATFLQGVLDTIQRLRPFADDLNRRYHGVPMGVVRGIPIEYGDGKVFEGGYFPIMWRFSEETGARKGWDLASGTRGSLNIETNDSYTKSRALKTRPKPVNLELRRIHSWVNGVIRDVAHRENLDALFNVVTDQEVAAAITRKIGGEDVFTGNADPSIRVGPRGAAADILNGMFRGLAYGDFGPEGAEGIAKHSAQAVKLWYAAVALGLNVRNVIEDQFNFVLGAVRGQYKLTDLAPFAAIKNAPKRAIEALVGPAKKGEIIDPAAIRLDRFANEVSLRKLLRDVPDESAVVRTRDRAEASAIADLVGEGEGVAHKVARWTFFIHRLSDKIQAAVIWDAAYRTAFRRLRKQLLSGEITAETASAMAKTYADRAVETILPPVHSALRPNALKAHNWLSALMLFQSYFLKQFSTTMSDVGDIRRVLKDPSHPLHARVMRAAIRSLRLAMVFALMGPVTQYVIGRGPDREKGEDAGQFLLRSYLQAMGQFTVPVFGSEAGGLAYLWAGEIVGGKYADAELHDLYITERQSPYASFMRNVWRVVDETIGAVQDEGGLTEEALNRIAKVMLFKLAPAGSQLERSEKTAEMGGNALEVFLGTEMRGGLPREIDE